MAGPNDFTGLNIQDTYQRVLQISSSGQITDGTGSVVTLASSAVVSASHALTASYAISASHEITYELSSSYAQTASVAQKTQNALTVGTGLDLSNSSVNWDGQFNRTLTLDLTEVIANDSANNFLTSDGDGTLTAETNLEISDSGDVVFAGGEIIGSGSRTGFQTSGFISGSTIIAENHITASGNISASGIIYAEHLYSSDDAEITDDLSLGGNLNLANNSKIVSTNTSTTYIKLNNDDYWIINANNVDTARFTSAGTVFNEGAAASQDFRVESLNDPYAFNIDSGLNAIELGRAATTNVTASGNISASGDVYAESIILPFGQAVNWGSHGGNHIRVDAADGNIIFDTLQVQMQNGLDVSGANGHITASGNISSSGYIIANNYVDVKTSGTGYKLSGAKIVYNENSAYNFGRGASATRITGSTISLGSPGDSAHVTASGNISASGYIYAGGDIHAVGDVVASSTTPSDYRLKENIKHIDRPLEKVLNLEGKEFDWKKSGESDYGLIAQDVEKIIPKLVKEKNILGAEETQKVVNYISIIPLLIESIKELNNKIEEIKNG